MLLLFPFHQVRDYCDVSPVACPNSATETTPDCETCDASGFNGTVAWTPGPLADNSDSFWDISECVAYCDDAAVATAQGVVAGGELWCDFARAGAEVCTVVPDQNFDCTGLTVTCRTDGSRACVAYYYY